MPELEVRFMLPGGSEARVDMYWERWRLVGECDGLGKYGAAEGEVAVRRRLRAEKARQNGLEALGNTRSEERPVGKECKLTMRTDRRKQKVHPQDRQRLW